MQLAQYYTYCIAEYVKRHWAGLSGVGCNLKMVVKASYVTTAVTSGA